jgi:pectinesterase
MIIAVDESGDFRNIQEAIDSIKEDNKERIIIYIRPGIYKQKLNITKPFISLIGEDAENTIITYDDCANNLLPNAEKMGTFNSYTLYVSGDDFYAENITVENAAGSGEKVGQAVALYANGDRFKMKNCRLLGCQDTLFTAPLPPKPLSGNRFGGPGEDNPRKNLRQYFENCYIRGDVDFIFGSATAVFNKCELFSNNRNKSVNGFITAASTPEESQFGYVFLDCKLSSDAAEATVFLGRPWRGFAKTVFINCNMGKHIIPEGWNDWGKTYEVQNQVLYAEYNSKGPGALMDKRISWAKQLTDIEAEKYSLVRILSGEDCWMPMNE